MRDNPLFDSTTPDDAPLTSAEQAEVDARLARLAVLRAGEDEIPELQHAKRD